MSRRIVCRHADGLYRIQGLVEGETFECWLSGTTAEGRPCMFRQVRVTDRYVLYEELPS